MTEVQIPTVAPVVIDDPLCIAIIDVLDDLREVGVIRGEVLIPAMQITATIHRQWPHLVFASERTRAENAHSEGGRS